MDSSNFSSSRDWAQAQGQPTGEYVKNLGVEAACARPPYDSVLAEADKAVNGERQENYGSQRENFQRIADMWRVILGVPVTPQQVAMCMIALKLARLVHTNGQHRDSVVDVAGYAECLSKINHGL